MRTTSLLGVAVIATTAAACSSTFFSGELAGYDSLATKIRFFYADNAKEENGRCLRPTIKAITRTEVVEDTADQLVVTIRYRYEDERFDNRLDPNGIPWFPPFTCEGFENRTFTIDKGEGDLTVVAMTGPTRERRNFGRSASSSYLILR